MILSLEVTSGCPCDEAVPPEDRSLHPSLSSPTWRWRDVWVFSSHVCCWFSDSRFQWKVSYFLSPGLHKSQMLDVTWSLWWRILCVSRHERNTGDWIGFCRRASEGLRALEMKPQEKWLKGVWVFSLVKRRKGPERGEEGDTTAVFESFKGRPLEYGVDLCFLDSRSGSQKGSTLAWYKGKKCRGRDFLR